MNLCDKPLAAKGLKSYRYRGTFGWIMIGAKDIDDALREASRNVLSPVVIERLQYWNGVEYLPCVKGE